MDRQTKLALAVLGFAAVLAWLGFSPWSPLTTPSTPPGPLDPVWRPGVITGKQRQYTCPAADIDGCLSGPHPLYRRPPRVGHHRAGLIDYGWDWIINPPSEAQTL